MRTPPTRTPFRSGNPALSERVFAGGVTVTGDAMTVQGTINKAALLLVLAFATAAASWVVGTAGGARTGGWALGAALATQAVALTFGVLGAMLLVYKTGLVKVTQRFRRA
jgi:uncharacterized YccA/Bax inhibitor family protein